MGHWLTRDFKVGGLQAQGLLGARWTTAGLTLPLAVSWLCLFLVGFIVGQPGFQRTAGRPPEALGSVILTANTLRDSVIFPQNSFHSPKGLGLALLGSCDCSVAYHDVPGHGLL